MRRGSCLVFAFLAACGGEGPSDAGTFAVSDSAGIEIVESFSPAWGEGVRQIDPEPLVRIGREEEGPYRFGTLFSGRLVGDGVLAIPVLDAQELRFFDSTGNHIRTVGRAGEGPGEFRSLFQAFRFPGDSIAAFDGRLERTTIVSVATGAYRSFPRQYEGNFGVFGVLGDGRSLMYSGGGAYHPELEPGLQWVATDVIVMEPDDGAARVIASLPGRQQLIEPDGNTGSVIPEFYAVQAVADDGFYWGTPDRYEIGLHDADGQLRRILRRQAEPTAVTPAMVEAWIDAMLEELGRFQDVAQIRQRYEEALIKESLPHFESAFVDGDQRLWLAAPSWPSFQSAPRRWSVFSPDGVWLGDLEAPERVRIVDSLGDVVLGIGMDELDVPYVQLHRLIG